MRVVVVGGGVIGCSTAFALARRGAEVVVVERGSAGSGASSAAAGMLAPLSESEEPGPFLEIGLEALSGVEDWVRAVEEAAGTRVDLVRSGVLKLARNDDQAAELRVRLDWQRAHDRSVRYLSQPELYQLLPQLGPGFAGALNYPPEAQVDARRYADALRLAVETAGGRLMEGVAASRVMSGDGAVTAVETSADRLAADAVVIATGSEPELLRQAGIDLPLSPVKGEMLRLRPQARLPPQIVFAPGGYLTPKADGTVLVGATQFPGRHDLEVEAGSMAQLLEFAFMVYPTLRRARFVEAWAGLRPGLPDRLPAIGLTPHLKGLWVAVGHHRNGILLSGWTGERLAAAILEAAPLPNAVSPARFRHS